MGRACLATLGSKGERYTRLGQDKTNKGAAKRQAPDSGTESSDAAMGTALRTVYQKTVDEQIPDDLLDLLGKLQ